MQTREMIANHPDVQGNVSEKLVAVIDHARACAIACTACADACLAEHNVADMRQCIRTDLDCADMCNALAAMASRRTGANVEVLRAALEACATACRACAEDCEKHADMHAHCRMCGEACRACANVCAEALTQVQ